MRLALLPAMNTTAAAGTATGLTQVPLPVSRVRHLSAMATMPCSTATPATAPPASPSSACVERALSPSYRNVVLTASNVHHHIYRAVRTSDGREVGFKLLATFDTRSNRWRGPARSEAQSLVYHYEKLKWLEQRGVHPVIRAFEVLQTEIECQPETTQTQVTATIPTSASASTSGAVSPAPLAASIASSPPLGVPATSPIKFKTFAMISEWYPGRNISVSLNEPRYQHGFPLAEFFPIALQLCLLIHHIQQEPLQRKGITLNDILHDKESNTIKLLHYGLNDIDSVRTHSATTSNSTSHSYTHINSSTTQHEQEGDKQHNNAPHSHQWDLSPAAPAPALSSSSLVPAAVLDCNTFNGRTNFLWLCFMSPEQTGRVYRTVDGRSDVYSLGVIFFALLTAKLPFVSHSVDELELIHAIITKTAPPVHALRSSVPPVLSNIISKCMHKLPSQRYQSTRGLEADLARLYRQLLDAQTRLGRVLPVPSAVSGVLVRGQSAVSEPMSGSSQRSRSSSSSSTDSPSLVATTSPARSPMLLLRSLIGEPSPSPIHNHTQTITHAHSPSGGSVFANESAGISSTHSSRRTHQHSSNDSSLALTLPPAPSTFVAHSFSHSTLPPTDAELGLTASLFHSFLLGREDIPSRLFIPAQLFGRDEQKRVLTAALHQMLETGRSTVVTVKGLSGCGKSSLVRSVLTDFVSHHRHCFVAASKLDLYTRTPFQMWKPIVNDFIASIFALSSSSVAEWKQRILESVGPNGAILIELFPVLVKIIGPQPPVPELPPQEASRRLRRTLVSFMVRNCMGAKRPVIVVFDDSQWGDLNSLELLETLVAHPDSVYITSLLVYRSEEVDIGHPLANLINGFQRDRVPLTEIECPLLSVDELQSLVSNALHTSPQSAAPIAAYLHQRTYGNPFFARALLVSMARNRILVYRVHARAADADESDETGVSGEWRLTSLLALASMPSSGASTSAGADGAISSGSSGGSGGVIHLVLQLVKKLDQRTQRVLALAAFIGATFDTSTLAAVSGLTLAQVSTALSEAIREELLELRGDHRIGPVGPVSASAGEALAVDSEDEVHETNGSDALVVTRCAFVHDRVQQACAAVIPIPEQPAVHLHIARTLWERAKRAAPNHAPHGFQIAGHVIQSLPLIERGSPDARKWAEFLLAASKRAQNKASYNTALSYITAAQQLVIADIDEQPTSDPQTETWTAHYAFTLSLSLVRSELEYLNGRHARCESELLSALSHVTAVLDRVKLFQLLQTLYTTQMRPKDVFRINRQALTELGQPVPVHGDNTGTETTPDLSSTPLTMSHLCELSIGPALVSLVWQEYHRRLPPGRSIPALLDELPVCTDPIHQAISATFAAIMPAAFIFVPHAVPVFGLLALFHCLDNGVSGSDAYTFAIVASIVMPDPVEANIRRPAEFGDLSLAVCARHANAHIECRSLIAIGMMQFYYFPVDVAECSILRGQRLAIENGEMLFANYAPYLLTGTLSFHLNLEPLRLEVERLQSLIVQLANDPVSGHHLQGQRLVLRSLMDPNVLEPKELSPEELVYLRSAEKVSPVAAASFYIGKARLAYILDAPQTALTLLTYVSEAKLGMLPDATTLIIVRLLSALAVVRQRCEQEADWRVERVALWATIESDLARLRRWAATAPTTFLSALRLSEAECEFTRLVERLCARDTEGKLGSEEDREVEEHEINRLAAMYRRSVMGALATSTSNRYRLRRHDEVLSKCPLPSAPMGISPCPWLNAIAFLRWGEFWLRFGLVDGAMSLITTSFAEFQRYGAAQKLKQLLALHGDRFEQILQVFGAKPSASFTAMREQLKLHPALRSAVQRLARLEQHQPNEHYPHTDAGSRRVSGCTGPRSSPSTGNGSWRHRRLSALELERMPDSAAVELDDTEKQDMEMEMDVDMDLDMVEHGDAEAEAELGTGLDESSGVSLDRALSGGVSGLEADEEAAVSRWFEDTVSMLEDAEAEAATSSDSDSIAVAVGGPRISLSAMLRHGSSGGSDTDAAELADLGSPSGPARDSRLSFTDLDLKTVIKATQAISREIVLSKLLTTLLKNVVRVTGSERCLLLSISAESPRQQRSKDTDPGLSAESDNRTMRPFEGCGSSSVIDGGISPSPSVLIDAMLSANNAIYIRPALLTPAVMQAQTDTATMPADAHPDTINAGVGSDEGSVPRRLSASSSSSSTASPTALARVLSGDEEGNDASSSYTRPSCYAYPQSVMNFVIHSHQSVILADAARDPLFGRDPYIQRHQLRSLLCLPLIHRGGLTSVLYLDNRVTAGLFRRERLLICRLIAAQASISIDNARLYERVTQYTKTLEARVTQRTQQPEDATRRAQEASRTKSTFLANMSHEIRTPMNGVIGGTDLLLDPLTSVNLTSEQREILGIVRTSGEAMLTIINDILDLSKIEAGRVELALTWFPVRDCVESAIDVIASKAQSKGLEVQYRAKSDVPYLIQGDYKRLTQILFNLLSNATKFTSHGDVTVELDVADSDETAPSPGLDSPSPSPFPAPFAVSRSYVLRLSVRDTGIGIPQHLHTRLFQPFSQVHMDAARNTGGTGLGLVISKHLVELMGGKMGIESEMGQGSTFHFTIACAGDDRDRPAWLRQRISRVPASVPAPLLLSPAKLAVESPVLRSVNTPTHTHIYPLLTNSPLLSSAAESPPASPHALFRERLPRILLIHPLRNTSHLIVETVATWHVSTLVAASVSEACAVLSQSPSPEIYAVLTDYRAISQTEQIDAMDSAESGTRHGHTHPFAYSAPPPASTSPTQSLTLSPSQSVDSDDELDSLQQHVTSAHATSHATRYTPAFELLAQLTQAVSQYRAVRRLPSGEPDPNPLPIIALAPLTQQRKIRVLLRANTTELRAFVTTPIKPHQLYRVLRDAARGDLPINLAAETSVTSAGTLSVSVGGIVSTSTGHPRSRSGSSMHRRVIESVANRAASKRSVGAPNAHLAQYFAAQFPAACPVLIVEDNIVNQKVLQRMLRRLGIEANRIATVDNGQRALDFVLAHGHGHVQDTVEHTDAHSHPSEHEQSPSPSLVVLMDVFMPVMDGLEATRAIRASSLIPPHYQPYIIALTANAMQGDKQVCLTAGMNHYLPKPITLHSLASALMTAVKVSASRRAEDADDPNPRPSKRVAIEYRRQQHQPQLRPSPTEAETATVTVPDATASSTHVMVLSRSSLAMSHCIQYCSRQN